MMGDQLAAFVGLTALLAVCLVWICLVFAPLFSEQDEDHRRRKNNQK